MQKEGNLVETAVLLIGFNRPEIIAKSFKCIADEKPDKLYVAIDGPRDKIPTDVDLVNQVKDMVTSISWPCQVKYLFNKQNMGAEVTVSSAVSWVLKEEETVIVIEDDIVAATSFFRFCEEMLIKYKENENIYMISGGQFTPIQLPNDEDYLFAIHGHTGTGWATWRRAWQHYSLFIDVETLDITKKKIRAMSSNKAQELYIESLINRMKENGSGNNTWDYCWLFILYYNQGLSIIPRVNLTSDIGILGLHARGKTEHHYRAFDKKFIVKKHPKYIKQNKKYDAYHAKKHLFRQSILKARFKQAWIYKILRKMKHSIE